MDIGDVRWSSLREASRRFLRNEDLVLHVRHENKTSALHLVQNIADNIPSRLSLPTIVVTERDYNFVEGLIQLNGTEPSEEICWVPGEVWDDFVEVCVELLEAGYPGCVGCAGPEAEEEWNEGFRRSSFS